MTGLDSMPALLERLAALLSLDDELPDPSTLIGRATHEFFANNWQRAREGLLARTTRLRAEPQPSPSPRIFHFEIDCAFKRKRGAESPVELSEGPLRGMIRYRPDIYTAPPDQPSLTVFLDRSLELFHPNYSRRYGVLCVGDLPPGPFPLEDLLEHLYGILTYQNTSTSDPADAQAAAYFALDPGAMNGLEAVEPLYP